MLPALVEHWQELVIGIEALSGDLHNTQADTAEARSHLHALLGIVTLKPRDGILWAHPAPNPKGLTEVKPLDDLHINRQKMVAGARLCNFVDLYTDFPLVVNG